MDDFITNQCGDYGNEANFEAKEMTPQAKRTFWVVMISILTFIAVYYPFMYYQNNFAVHHTMINAPFDEELYKYNMFQEFRKFKDEFDGKFEVVTRQLGGHNPLNITFYNLRNEVLSSHDIRDMKSDDLVKLIRVNKVLEHPNKDHYRNHVKANKEKTEDEAYKRVMRILEEGSEEEKSAVEESLKMLGTTKETFMAERNAAKVQAAGTTKEGSGEVQQDSGKNTNYDKQVDL